METESQNLTLIKSGKLLRSTLILTFGRVSGYGLSFIRNVILARVLAKADYGLAAVFGMAMTLLEIGGRMAFGQQIIQAKQGDSPDFQASAHALQFMGGVCSAVLIASMSVPLARIFHVPNAWWAFASLAVVPLCQGLIHLDTARRQREFDFFPLVFIDVVPQFLVTLAAYPLAIWLVDFRVIVWLMIGKAVMATVLSFCFAQRTYRWNWNREHVRSMLVFGWPLLLTGLVMFACQQANQVLVGAVFSLEILANYALAFSLVSIPWFILAQVGSSLMLPLMSRAQDDKELFRRQYSVCVEVVAVAGIVYFPLIVTGEQLVVVLFGAKYHGTGVFVALLGAAGSVRFLRFAPAVAALARADSINQLLSNLWRGISLPLAIAVVVTGGTPAQIAGCALVGECVAAVVSVVRLRRRQGIPLQDNFAAGAYVVILTSLGTGIALFGASNLNFWEVGALAIGGISISLCMAWMLFPRIAGVVIASMRKGIDHQSVQKGR